MKQQIKALLRRIQRWHQGCSRADIALVPGPTTLPPPHITWVLLVLIHYTSRRLWAWRALVTRVIPEARGCQDEGMEQSATINHAESGDVPDGRGWSYDLAGRIIRLKSRVTGECIELNIHVGALLVEVDTFFAYLHREVYPDVVTRRLRELFPMGGLLAAIGRLRDYGVFEVLEEEPGGDVLSLRLRNSLLRYSEAIYAFLVAWCDPADRIALASLIWDWPALHASADSLGQVDLAARAAVLAEQARRRWLTLLRMDAEHGLCESTLLGLADSRAEDLSDYLTPALANPLLAPAANRIADPNALRRGQWEEGSGIQ